MLNPQYLKDMIPGDYRPYNLTLPTQQCLSYIMSEKKIHEYDKDLYARRTTAEPGGSSSTASVVSDGGQANLAKAEKQTANSDSNKEIASQATERIINKTHVVARGENIRDIAKAYGVSATDIKRWNKLRRGKVKEGDQLTIQVVEHITPEEVRVVATPEVAQVFPSENKENGNAQTVANESTGDETAKTVAEQPKPRENTQQTKAVRTTTHVVKKGDTLDRIARKYGTTVAAIQAANGMKKTQTGIQIGQKLKIPAKGGTVSSAKKSSGKKATRKKTTRRRK